MQYRYIPNCKRSVVLYEFVYHVCKSQPYSTFFYMCWVFPLLETLSQSSVIWHLLVFSAVVQNSSGAGEENKLRVFMCRFQYCTHVHFSTIIQRSFFAPSARKNEQSLDHTYFKRIIAVCAFSCCCRNIRLSFFWLVTMFFSISSSRSNMWTGMAILT